MSRHFNKTFLTGSLVFLLFIAKAQEPALQNSINLSVSGWNYEKHQQNGTVTLAYEWKPWHFVGLEFGGGYGWLRDYDLIRYSVKPNVYQNISLEEINGDYWVIQGKLSGYLPLWRDDDNIIRIQLFADALGGMNSSIQMEGELRIFEQEQVETASGNGKVHFFSGFEFGLWGALSDKISMKLFVGGRNINFKEPIEKMNSQVNGFPLSFSPYVPSSYFGTSLCLTIPKRKVSR